MVGRGVRVYAIDETTERRWGRCIRTRGIYRDAVRFSGARFAKASGLRWMCLTLVTATRWTPALWALPVLTALCPSARYYAGSRRPAKKLTDVAHQLIGWLGRSVVDAGRGLGQVCVLTADRSYCTYALMAAARKVGVTLVTDTRLDAWLFAEPAPRRPGRSRCPAERGAQLPAMGSLVTTPEVEWRGFTAAAWRGVGGEHTLDYATRRAIWHKPGEPAAYIKWVSVRTPSRAPVRSVTSSCSSRAAPPSTPRRSSGTMRGGGRAR